MLKKKIVFFIVFSYVALCSIFGQANTKELPIITIVNNTGYSVYYVYISQTAADSWGGDRLGSAEVLLNGDSFSIRLPYPLNVTNRYDIKLVDEDGDTYSKWNVLITPNAQIEFTFDDFSESS